MLCHFHSTLDFHMAECISSIPPHKYRRSELRLSGAFLFHSCKYSSPRPHSRERQRSCAFEIGTPSLYATSADARVRAGALHQGKVLFGGHVVAHGAKVEARGAGRNAYGQVPGARPPLLHQLPDLRFQLGPFGHLRFLAFQQLQRLAQGREPRRAIPCQQQCAQRSMEVEELRV